MPIPRSANTRRQEQPPFQAILARTRTVHRPMGPVAYDS